MARSRQNASAGWPEVVHTRSTPRRTINREVAAGRLRPLGPRLYTTNLADDDATIIRRNIWRVIALLAPSGIISARTGLTLRPTAEGTVFLVGPTKYDRDLPGLRIRVAKRSPAQEGDFPYLDGLLIASRPRALLEALQYPARPRGRTARTLTNAGLEQELEKILQTGGEFALNRLRDEARALAPALHAGDAYERLSQRIAVCTRLPAGRNIRPAAHARLDGAPYDADRIALFESLFARLRSHEAPDRPVADESPAAFANVSFFDAYFSNFIEGTEFEIDEARAIVFDGYIPNARPEDAKDVLGTLASSGTPFRCGPAFRPWPHSRHFARGSRPCTSRSWRSGSTGGRDTSRKCPIAPATRGSSILITSSVLSSAGTTSRAHWPDRSSALWRDVHPFDAPVRRW